MYENKFVMYGRICRLLKQKNGENHCIIKKYIELAIKRGYVDKGFTIRFDIKNEDAECAAYMIVDRSNMNRYRKIIDDFIEIADRIERYEEQKYDRVYRV